MGLVIGSGVVLSEFITPEFSQAIICFDNVLGVDNVSATSASADNPITNIANASTSFLWEAGSTSSQTITINSDGRDIDYVGLARHNLNQPGLTIEVKFNGVTVLQPQAVPNRDALLLILAVATPTTIQIVISGAQVAAKVAVVYAGKSLILERGLYVGHTPITYGRDRTAINGISENGQYLGEIVVRETNSTQVSLKNLTPLWYRENLDPFFSASPRAPCFWSWRSIDYPSEVGYCWTEGNPKPVNQLSNGMMSIDWNFKGIV